MNKLIVKAYYQKAQTPFNTMEFDLGDFITREKVLNTEEDIQYSCDTFLKKAGTGLTTCYQVAVSYYGVQLWIDNGHDGEQYFDFRQAELDDIYFETIYQKD